MKFEEEAFEIRFWVKVFLKIWLILQDRLFLKTVLQFQVWSKEGIWKMARIRRNKEKGSSSEQRIANPRIRK